MKGGYLQAKTDVETKKTCKMKQKNIYMTQDCSCEASYNSTAKLNSIPQGVVFGYGKFSFFSDRSEYKLVAEFIDSELTNCVGYLSENYCRRS